MVGGRAPAKPPWSEVMIFFGDFLRREAPNRRNLSAQMSGFLIGGQPCAGYIVLRRANAGRRTMRGGWPNSGEAAVVGGNDYFV